MPLTADERRQARFLRVDVGMDFADIAVAIGRSEQDVRHSLATLRTPSPAPKRGPVTVSPAAIDELRMRQHPGEAMWQTMNRVLGIP